VGHVTHQLSADLAGLYPEVGQAGSLQASLQTAVYLAGYPLAVLPERPPGWRLTGALVEDSSRATHTLLGIKERCFLMAFWERGVNMANGTTTDLDAVATAAGLWQPGATLRELQSASPFVRYGALAQAYESGDPVEAKWKSYRETSARHIDHELIEAAYAQPRLRALFPFTSHYTLCLSQCTRFPFTHDLPVIDPIGNGRYRVSWPTRSPTGPAAIGETDNPDDGAALLVDHLPETCGPAVDATADDLDTTDSTE
jgi:hypothetical protein